MYCDPTHTFVQRYRFWQDSKKSTNTNLLDELLMIHSTFSRVNAETNLKLSLDYYEQK